VWSLRSGHQLTQLSGHEGPIACLALAPTGAILASGSWDGTLKLWNIYESSCIDTFAHACDVLDVSFRPDGKELCTCATNGMLAFFISSFLFHPITITQVTFTSGMSKRASNGERSRVGEICPLAEDRVMPEPLNRCLMRHTSQQ
jgi:WD40 repeat protein